MAAGVKPHRSELDELLATLDEEERQSDGFLRTPSGGRGAARSEEEPAGSRGSGQTSSLDGAEYVDGRRRCVRVRASTRPWRPVRQ